MRKLTILNQQYPPETVSTGQIFRAMAEYLAARGFSVTVGTGTPYYPGAKGNCPKREEMGGVLVKRLWNTTFPKESMLGKLLNLLTFQISLLFYCIFHIEKGQTVLVATAPPMAVTAAAIGKFFRRYKLVMTVQDLYPDALAASGMSSEKKLSYRFLRAVMRRSMRACDKVITISEDMRGHLMNAYGLKDVALIPNIFPETISPLTPREAKAVRGWQDKLIVQYSGNFGVAHEPDTLFAAVRALRDEPRILFHITGSGRNYEKLRGQCEAEKSPNIVFEGYAPLSMLEAHLALADISVVILDAAFQNVLLPSKFYGILASGRATLLISGCESDISRDIHAEQIGFCFDHGQGDAVAETLRALLDDPSRLAGMGAHARALYDRRYTQQVLLDAYRQLLEDC